MEGKRAVILVVDDTETNVDILVELLNDLYEVIVAIDGESALEIAHEEDVDLILLDIMMPGMDGYEVCRRLKENERMRDIPVIFITANTSEESIEKAYDLGGNDYVTKPFKPKELLARVNRELEMQKLIRDLKASKEELKILAATDPLTKLYNRRYFSKISEDIFNIAKRKKSHLSLIMIDIDKFKKINDTYGHQTGDEVIMALAKIMIEQKRDSDIACRYGGEEFVILLPETDIDGSEVVAEKIRTKVEKNILKTDGGNEVAFTVSVGVADVDPEKEKNIEKALGRADEALYRAKEKGRNRVCR